MLTAFKTYCKDAVVGFTVGATVGATAGSLAGKIGLNQVCNRAPHSDSCQSLVDQATNDSVQMGATAGAGVGGAIGMFLYPMYRALARAIWEKEVRPDLSSSDSLGYIPRNS